VRIFVNDRSTAAATATVDTAGEGTSVQGNTTYIRQRAPAWVRESAAYQSAMQGAVAFAEAGEGLSVAAAAAAGAELGETAGGVGVAAARPGSIVAWVYVGLADTGGAGESILDTDAMAASARWVVRVG
jgi:hypothetical protein